MNTDELWKGTKTGTDMTDYIVRATAANAQIRAFACTARETVETARAAHNTSPVVTAALGRLLCAGAMMAGDGLAENRRRGSCRSSQLR